MKYLPATGQRLPAQVSNNMANESANESVERTAKNQPISAFLEFADLEKFKSAFEIFGVSKFDHLQDVHEDDLQNFSMYFDLIFDFTNKE